jgi:hypothetical protein
MQKLWNSRIKFYKRTLFGFPFLYFIIWATNYGNSSIKSTNLYFVGIGFEPHSLISDGIQKQITRIQISAYSWSEIFGYTRGVFCKNQWVRCEIYFQFYVCLPFRLPGRSNVLAIWHIRNKIPMEHTFFIDFMFTIDYFLCIRKNFSAEVKNNQIGSQNRIDFKL